MLVHLYEEYGDAMLHALEGMFAFALWDARKQRLLLGRDRFGEKPLFFSHRGGELRFASELTALLAPGGIDAELDRQAVDAFLVFGYVPGPGSILTRDPPASARAHARLGAGHRRREDRSLLAPARRHELLG